MRSRDGKSEQGRPEGAPAPGRRRDVNRQILALQGMAGNRAVAKLLRSPPQNYLGSTVEAPDPELREGRTVIREGPQQVDPVATARALRSALDAQIRADEELLGDEARLSESGVTRAALEQAIAQARRDKASLDGGYLSMGRMSAIAARNGLAVRPSMRSATGVEVVSDATASTTGLAYSRTRTRTAEGDGTHRTTAIRGGFDTTTGVTGTHTTTTTHDDLLSGTQAQSTVEHSLGADASSATYTRTSSTRATDATGASVSDSTRRRHSLAGGSGRVTYTGTTTVTHSEAGASGTTTRSDATTTTRATSLVHGDAGTGAAHERSTERTVTTAGREYAWRRSADGRITMNVARDSADPTKWRVTFVIHVGGSLRGSGRAGSGVRPGDDDAAGNRFSGSATGAVGADFTVTRVMTEAELTSSLGVDMAAIRSGTDAQGRDDVGLEARLRALYHLGPGSALDTLAVVSADRARALREGESSELLLSAAGDVTLGAERRTSGTSMTRGSLGVDFGAGATVSRTARVTRRGGVLYVTIIVAHEGRLSGGVSGRYGLATGSVRGSSTDTGSRAIEFKLDEHSPDFDRIFGRLRTATTVTALERLVSDYPSILSSRTTTAGHTGSTTASAGIVGVSLGITDSSSSTHTVTRGADHHLTGTMTGSHTTGADLTVFGTRVVRGSETDTATGTVNADGDLALDISRSRDETDTRRSWRDTRERMRGRSTADQVGDVAGQGVGGFLRGIAERTYSHLSGYDVSAQDVDVLVQRAGNESMWARGVSSPRFYQQWLDLRRVMVDPHPPQDWLDADSTEDHRAAKNLFRAQALADFMATAGDRGYDGVEYVLRGYGNFGFTDVYSDRLGMHYEWPPALAATRTRFNDLRARVGRLDTQLADYRTAAQGQAGHAILSELSSGLSGVLSQVNASGDFEDPEARIEIVDEIRRLQASVTAAGRNLDRHVTSAASATPPRPVPAPVVTAEGATITADPERVAAERVRLETERDRLIRSLADHRAEQTRLIGVARANLPISGGGTLRESGWGGFVDVWRGSPQDAIDAMDSLRQVDRDWIAQITALREVYRTLGTPEGQWVVSSGPGQPRHPQTEPDIDTARRLFIAAGERAQFYFSAGNRDELVGNFDRLRNY